MVIRIEYFPIREIFPNDGNLQRVVNTVSVKLVSLEHTGAGAGTRR